MPASPRLSRRDLLKLSAAGVVGGSFAPWLGALAARAAESPQRRRACILLWMNGGPTQTDTFDMKPGHANGGQFRPIQTAVPGIHISEHLPQLARETNDMALIRSMSSREGDHGRATYLLHTGYLPQGPIQYPTLGSLVSKELGQEDSALPNFVSIAPFRQFNAAAYGSGFLGPQYAPLLVGESANPFNAPADGDYGRLLQVQDLHAPGELPVTHFDSRISLLQDMERDFAARTPSAAARSHSSAYDRAVRLMRTSARTAFDLDEEPGHLRDAYGRNLFGQGCLLARRLVERGVPFVEVTLGAIPGSPIGWDTHGQNFQTVRRLCEILDPAWATLMRDLRQRGLLQDTLIVWMGEFGRTPRLSNNGDGRDHFQNAWTTVLAGGGIRGGQVFGSTTADGMAVDGPRPVSVPDFAATIASALGIDPTKQNMSNVGRPIRIADNGARPIREVLA
jgi:hypothetical protein